MQIRSGVYWSSGTEIEHKNQDSLSLQQIRLKRGETILALVADGVGSLSDGEEASGYAVRQLTYWFYHEYKNLIFQKSSFYQILDSLQKQIYHIQKQISDYQKTYQMQMGTTLTGILIYRNKYFLLHIGDSRAYLIRKKQIPLIKSQKYKIQCLTKDDKNSKNELVKCLGVFGTDTAYFDIGKIKKNSIFYLCTDGAYRNISSTEVARVLGTALSKRSEDIERRLELLGTRAADGKWKDDITMVGVVLR